MGYLSPPIENRWFQDDRCFIRKPYSIYKLRFLYPLSIFRVKSTKTLFIPWISERTSELNIF